MNINEHECCGCYQSKVPADLRALLDWVERFKNGARAYSQKKVSDKQAAYFAFIGSKPPFFVVEAPSPAPKETT